MIYRSYTLHVTCDIQSKQTYVYMRYRILLICMLTLIFSSYIDYMYFENISKVDYFQNCIAMNS